VNWAIPLTVLIFGVVNAVLFGTGLVRHSRIYLDLHSHPWPGSPPAWC
jgi:hypothetical protein